MMMVALLSGMVMLAVGGVLYAALPGLSRSTPAQRRVEVIAAPRTSKERRQLTDDQRRRRNVESTLKDIEEKQKARTSKSTKPTLTLRMRQAGLAWSKQTYWLITGGAVVVMAPALMILFGMPMLMALFGGVALGLVLPHFYVNFVRKRRLKKFANEFPNAVDVVVRGVKAGLPLVDCLKIISREAQEPVRSEFREVIDDQTLGLPLEEAVGRLAERVPTSEATFFSIVLAIQSKTGGSLSEALGNLSKVLRERKKMQGKIRAVSQEAKSSAAIIGALPIVVAGIVYLSSREYIMLLFTESLGNYVLMGCGVWMAIGIAVMRKMINFDY